MDPNNLPQPVAEPAYIRACQLPKRYPVLGRSTWMHLVARGDLHSFKIGRARLVRMADVVAFLEGHGTEAAR